MTTQRTIVFPIFSDVTQLDFTGPLQVLGSMPDVQCVIASATGGRLQIGPGMVLRDLPRLSEISDCFLLCVPGGRGTIDALVDEQFIQQIRRLAAKAEFVTSVCTGSLLLGAAGLLAGKRAACHWSVRQQLASFGAIPDTRRVVRDGSVVTGGGVTAGIDMALEVVADLMGVQYAQGLQLSLEYAPQPPYHCGRPEFSSPEVLQAAGRSLAPLVRGVERSAAVAAERLTLPT